MIDLAAQLYLAGMIDVRGKYVPEKCGERMRTIDEVHHLTIVSSKDSGTEEALTLASRRSTLSCVQRRPCTPF